MTTTICHFSTLAVKLGIVWSLFVDAPPLPPPSPPHTDEFLKKAVSCALTIAHQPYN
jgi:hypothetical protein